MPTIVKGVGKERIKEICACYGLNLEEESIILKILREWVRVVEKEDKLKIVINNTNGNKKIIRVLTYINKEYLEKMKKLEMKRKIQDDMLYSVRG